MEKEQPLPVQLNITKIVVFISALLFTTGIYLIVSTGTEWLYFSEFYTKISFSNQLEFGVIIFLVLLILSTFLFPSNDFLNFSLILQKRASSKSKKFLIYFAKVETSILVYLFIILIAQYISSQLIIYAMLLISVVTVLFQTSFASVQKRVNIIDSQKLNLMNVIDQYFVRGSTYSNLTGGFFMQLFPMIENLLMLLLALMMPSIWWSIFIIVFAQTFLYIFEYWQPFQLSKRGNYFRKYVNVMFSLILLYFAYLLLI